MLKIRKAMTAIPFSLFLASAGCVLEEKCPDDTEEGDDDGDLPPGDGDKEPPMPPGDGDGEPGDGDGDFPGDGDGEPPLPPGGDS